MHLRNIVGSGLYSVYLKGLISVDTGLPVIDLDVYAAIARESNVILALLEPVDGRVGFFRDLLFRWFDGRPLHHSLTHHHCDRERGTLTTAREGGIEWFARHSLTVDGSLPLCCCSNRWGFVSCIRRRSISHRSRKAEPTGNSSHTPTAINRGI